MKLVNSSMYNNDGQQKTDVVFVIFTSFDKVNINYYTKLTVLHIGNIILIFTQISRYSLVKYTGAYIYRYQHSNCYKIYIG